MSDKNSEKIQELQMLEQNAQQLSLQRQAFQFEINETENALEELSKEGEEVFKIVGQVMIKSDKKNVESDLKKKLGLLNIRIKAIDSQEKNIVEKADDLRKELSKSMDSK